MFITLYSGTAVSQNMPKFHDFMILIHFVTPIVIMNWFQIKYTLILECLNFGIFLWYVCGSKLILPLPYRERNLTGSMVWIGHNWLHSWSPYCTTLQACSVLAAAWCIYPLMGHVFQDNKSPVTLVPKNLVFRNASENVYTAAYHRYGAATTWAFPKVFRKSKTYDRSVTGV